MAKEIVKKEKETSILYRNIRMNERKEIYGEEVKIDTVVFYQMDPKVDKRFGERKKLGERVETKTFPLREISLEELTELRKTKKPSFVLKEDGRYYYAEISPYMTFIASSFLGEHKCAAAGKVCNLLSAAPDEEGGCEKVRNRSANIERYPWIIKGYETFGMDGRDTFVVLECQHHEKTPPRPHRTLDEVNQMKLGLSYFIWEEGAENRTEMLERISKNHANYKRSF